MKIVLTIVGQDRIGIIAKVSTALADESVNVLDMNQNIMNGVFNMVMIADMSAATISIKDLQEKLDKVGDDIGRRHAFNTAIAAVMELLNALGKFEAEAGDAALGLRQEAYETVTLMLNPITPHMSHTLWQALGHPETLLEDLPWPQADASALVRDSVTLAVQVNGKLRGKVEAPAGASREDCERLALADPTVAKFLEGQTVKKLIVVPGKIVNIVVGG